MREQSIEDRSYTEPSHGRAFVNGRPLFQMEQASGLEWYESSGCEVPEHLSIHRPGIDYAASRYARTLGPTIRALLEGAFQFGAHPANVLRGWALNIHLLIPVGLNSPINPVKAPRLWLGADLESHKMRVKRIFPEDRPSVRDREVKSLIGLALQRRKWTEGNGGGSGIVKSCNEADGLTGHEFARVIGFMEFGTRNEAELAARLMAWAWVINRPLVYEMTHREIADICGLHRGTPSRLVKEISKAMGGIKLPGMKKEKR